MTKVTKKELLREMDEKLFNLNLLRSALEAEKSLKQETLESYKKRFYELVPPSRKKK